MDLIMVLLLAVIQGLTEFLPVSSSGHLLAVRYLLGVELSGSVAFDAYLHLGTLLAVLAYYWRTWGRLLQSLIAWHQPELAASRRLAVALVLATIPGAIVGWLLRNHASVLVSSPHRLALELVATAVILALTDRLRPSAARANVSYRDALLVGIAQIFALLPGISRSGVTIAAGRAQGLSRETATDFSFLMSAPIIAGAGLVSLLEVLATQTVPTLHLVLAFLASFISGLLGIFLLLAIVRRTSFLPFTIYLILLAAVIWYVR